MKITSIFNCKSKNVIPSISCLIGFYWVVLVCQAVTAKNEVDFEVKMPAARPLVHDLYLCTGKRVNTDDPIYIDTFKPAINGKNVHHLLVFVCDKPGTPNNEIWNCGEMNGNSRSNKYPIAPPCRGETQMIFSWAMDAPSFKLPTDISYKIGSNKHVIIQLHYKYVDKFIADKSLTDSSSVHLIGSFKPTEYVAGLYLSAPTSGFIPPNSRVFFEMACNYGGGNTGSVILHPFAFRTHAHSLGQLICGYIIRGNQWIKIGCKSPQKPQTFYMTDTGLTVKAGDILAARCIYQNNGTNIVNIGSTMKDEMCNFYMMYSVPIADAKSGAGFHACTVPGWPQFKWEDVLSEEQINNVPSSAAIIPGTTKKLKEYADMKNTVSELESEDDSY